MGDMDLVVKITGDDSPIKATLANLKSGASNMLSGLTGGAKSEAGGAVSSGGGIGSLLKALAPLAILTAIFQSSRMLQHALGMVLKVVGLILKPIGDILAVGLMPIIDILKPIGQFFRILMQPYIERAMEAMRVGRGFMKEGEVGKAAESYALGASFMMKPLMDLFTTSATMTIQGILSGISALGQAIIGIFNDDAAQAFGDSMDGMITQVGVTGAKIILESSAMMDEWLLSLTKELKEVQRTADNSMSEVGGVMGSHFVSLIGMSTAFFTKSGTDVADIFDKMLAYAQDKKNKIDALLALENAPPPSTDSSTSASGGKNTMGGRESPIYSVTLKDKPVTTNITVNSTIVVEKMESQTDVDEVVRRLNEEMTKAIGRQ